jgi:hypothetical protein
MGMRIDDEIYVHGYLDEIRQDKVIIRNEGGYFGTVADELVEVISKGQYESRLKAERKKIAEDVDDKMAYMGSCLNERNIILGIITGKRETLDSLCSTCKSESCVSNGTAISKADYEARLKADMMAMLEEIKLKITEKSFHDTTIIGNYEDEVRINLVELDDVNDIIQEKISTLEVENGNDNITSSTKTT